MATATYTKIGTTTLASTGTITFSSIPSTYTDLRLVLSNVKGTSNNTPYMQFNSDTATNYYYQSLTGYSSTVTPAATGGATGILIGPSQGVDKLAGLPGVYLIDIMSYASALKKSSLIITASPGTSSPEMSLRVGTWNSTSAITQIYIYMGIGSLEVGTVATLYGIKAA